ncbi:MAG: phosphatase PAP2 family protein [Deltaproteobacteria bacterium]|nr:phosphatase PAP2 family protein [Deltaproteobacteria bacterium]
MEEFLLVILAAVLVFSVWGFLGVLQDVVMKDPLVRADQAVYHFLQSLRNPWGDSVFVAITELGDWLVSGSVAAAVFLVLLLNRCRRSAGYWAAVLAGGACAVRILKWALHLPRPTPVYHGISAFGFPSGHAAMGLILYGFLAIVIARSLRGMMRRWFFAAAFLISFALAFSRLYLGVHWLSDVLGGILFASAWTALAGIGYLKGRPEAVPARLLGLAVIGVVATVGLWHVADRHSHDLAFYAPRRLVKVIDSKAWLTWAWQQLPAWRIDLGGAREEPLTIQFAGRPESLARYLISKGWHHPPPLNMRILLAALSPDVEMRNLPSLPRLHDGRLETMLLLRDEGQKRLALRLWPTDMQLRGGRGPVWVGTVEIQSADRIAGLITLPRNTGDYARPLQILSKTLNGRFLVREVFRGDAGVPARTGRVLLIMEMKKSSASLHDGSISGGL